MTKANVSTLYSTGRIRSLEGHLLSQEKMMRLIEAEDLQASLSLLRETSYGKQLVQEAVEFDIEKLINFEWINLSQLLNKIAPNNSIIHILRKKYDYLNAKLLLKAKYLKSGFSHQAIVPIGNINPNQLIFLINDNPNELPKELKELVSQVNLSIAENSDTLIIDTLFDQNYFSQLIEISQRAPSRLFKEYVKAQIDLANIKLLIKLDLLKNKTSTFKKPFIAGGRISNDTLSLPLAELSNRLSFTVYSTFLATTLKQYHENSNLYKLDKVFDDYILNLIKQAKYFTFGMEPLLGFFIAKEREIANLRMVLLCKSKKIAPELIKERIRDSYV